jgi:hypothetical protein
MDVLLPVAIGFGAALAACGALVLLRAARWRVQDRLDRPPEIQRNRWLARYPGDRAKVASETSTGQRRIESDEAGYAAAHPQDQGRWHHRGDGGGFPTR